MSYPTKENYSLFGDHEHDFKRFVYNAYLPYDHPDQGVRFVLTPDSQKLLCQKILQLEAEVTKRLKESFAGRIWPVDRLIVLLTIHSYVNASERVKCLLEYKSPSELRFNARFNCSEVKPPLTVKEFFCRIGSSSIFEQILVALFEYYNVEVKYEPALDRIKKQTFKGIQFIKSQLRPLKFKYNYWKSFIQYIRGYRNKKPLLLVLNYLLSLDDLMIVREISENFHLDAWINCMENGFPKKMAHFKKQSNLSESRKDLEQSLASIQLDEEDFPFKKVFSIIVKNYPISLIEGRECLKESAKKMINNMKFFRNDDKPFILSIDHGIWKSEIYSALASGLRNNGVKVVSSCHASLYGIFDYSLCQILDQCLATHYLINSRDPFIHKEEETPQIVEIELLKKWQPIGSRVQKNEPLSIWYFPHWHQADPAFHYLFNGIEHPEGYFENQVAALRALNRIAKDARVNEIVIKLRSDIKEVVKRKYFELFAQILGEDKSAKFRFVDDLSLQQAFPHISIAVMDMFSSTFLEAVWANIPTLAVLAQEEEIPLRMPDRDYWVKSGLFVRGEKDLFDNLLSFVEGKTPNDYEKMRQRFLEACGFGKPTAGQALKSILEKENGNR